ncbi:glutathione S-transferase family protein [Sandaracinobacteroides hominis]|uniref:glutathione S-transferase family protein n=1 Tax=Sandaracinobacteroides hominis TaxID=2780086 RepID=UPI0018F3BF71|nr:glutathione S-transferase family protein [Sandaracinobacteroides hominis]
MFELYGHPFSSFTWKPLIALHERRVEFRFRNVDPGHPDNSARLAEMAPIGQFPVLVHGECEICESNVIIEYLDLHAPGDPPMVPPDPTDALEARMMAEIFDDYVNEVMQKVVNDALAPEAERSVRAVVQAKGQLLRSYGWLEKKLAGREWGSGGDFGIADCAAAPALFYADWVEAIPDSCPGLQAYRARLLARPSVVHVVDEARPYRRYFPLGAPDRD